MAYKRIVLLGILLSIIVSSYNFSYNQLLFDGDYQLSETIEFTISEGGVNPSSFQSVITRLGKSRMIEGSIILSNYITQLFQSPIPSEKRIFNLMTVKFQSTFFSSLIRS
ncbi:hypothetical protein [Halalkalibacter alkaliphilus]|uniref:Uncharacterized protein n=1 Tax=Halalkalibacter alkaliphilus TaxID=2917993 RepID=A0A9X2CSP4_9BACI|nr:hypothetical protein [Halalkalibacter alkaliphilus]MCL7747362.1 hypothetical protein [Halalkalibacter alkaliphilus]